MTLALDGSSSGMSFGVTTVAAALTTTKTNDIIVVMVGAEITSGASINVASVAGGGLTWALRKRLQYNAGRRTPPNPQTYEVWWALAPSALSAVSITATFSGAADNATIVAFGVNGAKTLAPWDTNASLPVTNTDVIQTDNNPPSVSGVSTTAVNTMLIAGWSNSNAGPALAGPPTGFTEIAFPQESSGSDWSWQEVSYQIVSAAQSSITETFVQGRADWGIIADAIQAATPPFTYAQARVIG